jgi:hypothetical protein
VRKYTFVVRIVEIWNSLLESAIQAKTVKQFEIGLDDHWKRIGGGNRRTRKKPPIYHRIP